MHAVQSAHVITSALIQVDCVTILALQLNEPLLSFVFVSLHCVELSFTVQKFIISHLADVF